MELILEELAQLANKGGWRLELYFQQDSKLQGIYSFYASRTLGEYPDYKKEGLRISGVTVKLAGEEMYRQMSKYV